ncbi:hypothetical protein AB0O91_36310 [Kitasatospora sp. NPDC089797]|uniref:hypothetical protein n=1 Tax=Kitasatospora sp. NPDC089797 TaxID=3155298 RepID=UPI003417B49E
MKAAGRTGDRAPDSVDQPGPGTPTIFPAATGRPGRHGQLRDARPVVAYPRPAAEESPAVALGWWVEIEREAEALTQDPIELFFTLVAEFRRERRVSEADTA